MNKLSTVLKVLAIIVGVLCVAWGGLLGIVGTQPDGHSVPVLGRLFGFFILLQGILYFLPNAKIKKNRRLITSYLIATILPAVLLLNLTLYEIIADGWVKFVYGALKTVGILLLLSLLAPLSLICSILRLKDS